MVQKPLKKTAPKPLKETKPKAPKPVPVEKKRQASSESAPIDSRENGAAMGGKCLTRGSSKTSSWDSTSLSRKRKLSDASDRLDSRDDQLGKPTKSETPSRSTSPNRCGPPNLVDPQTTSNIIERRTEEFFIQNLSSDDESSDDDEPVLRIWHLGKESGSTEQRKGDFVPNRISPPSAIDDESSLPTLHSDITCFHAGKEISKNIPDHDEDSSDDEALNITNSLARKSNSLRKRHSEQSGKAESMPVINSAWEALVTASAMRSELFDC
jgi:hypothetical protein